MKLIDAQPLQFSKLFILKEGSEDRGAMRR